MEVTVVTSVNTTPSTSFIALNTSGDTNLTNQDLECWGKATDDDAFLTAYVKWWNGSEYQTGLMAQTDGVASGATTLLATLGSGNTTRAQDWNCSVIFSDATLNETSWTNATLTVLNTQPQHGTPILNATGTGNLTVDNLQCWNVSTSDNDTDTVQNIVKWHRNNTKQDSLENQTNISWGNTTVDDVWICEVIPFDGTANGTARNSTSLTIRDEPAVQITKTLSPDLVVAGLNETINVTTKVMNTKPFNITTINITDEIPYDFAYPQTTEEVSVYFVNSTDTIALSTGVLKSISNIDSDSNIELVVNISDLSATAANTYLDNTDRIELDYLMNSSKMCGNCTRTVYTNVSVVGTDYGGVSSNSTTTVINASQAVLRGYKTIDVELANPQMANITIVIKALGGNLTEIALSDYLPQGTTVNAADFRNVSYLNYSTKTISELVNGTDYYLTNGTGTLPDGTYADIYIYNFTVYSTAKWDKTLYENDNITISYNVSFVGGGSWVLPAIIGGWDPQYQKHIQTEMYPEASIPMFDVILDILTRRVNPGSSVVALLKMMNVGGPKAKVDVFITYSAKTMEGDLITERSETMAVVDQKEKRLSLALPGNIDPGMYTFEAFLTYTGREAMTTDTFEVGGKITEGVPIMEQYGIYIFLGIILVLILVLFRRTRTGKRERFAYRYKTPAKEESENRTGRERE